MSVSGWAIKCFEYSRMRFGRDIKRSDLLPPPLPGLRRRDAWVGRQRPSERKGVRETLGGLSARRYDAVGIGSRGRVSRELQVPTALDDLLEPK